MFPAVSDKEGKIRRFRHQWLTDNPWLVYSLKSEGGFCLPCLLLPSGADKGQLTASACVNFKKATSLHEKHRQQRSHLDAIARLIAPCLSTEIRC